jgi:hypothetical protein
MILVDDLFTQEVGSFDGRGHARSGTCKVGNMQYTYNEKVA